MSIASDFDEFLDKATEPKQREPNHVAMIRLCEMIDDEKIRPENAVQAIHCKIIDEDPQTVLFALKVLEVVFLKCGSIIHKVICTPEYMSLLKDIITSTEHKSIKDEIIRLLERWADLFKYFPQYSEPQRLLESLRPNADGLTNGQYNNNGNARLEQFRKNYGLQSDSCSSTVMIGLRKLNDNNMNSETTDTSLSEKENEFKSALYEYQAKKKQDYKRFLKSEGMPTSSDEEDNAAKKSMNGCQEKCRNEHLDKSHKLPKDLDNIKKQRHCLNAEAQAVRNTKHQNFLNDCGNSSVELSQCQDSNCEHCGRYKKKYEPEETVVPKRWPFEIRKIKESKAKLKEDFEDYKNLKKKAYYGHETDTGMGPELRSTSVKKSLTKGINEEEEQLKQAIFLSQMENEPLIGQDDYLEDEDGLQLAIDMSIAEAEKNRVSVRIFKPVPNSDDEDLGRSLTKQLCLNETNTKKIETDDSTNRNIGLCIICHNRNFLRRFEPCNHRCICYECADEYNSQMCPVCKDYYSTISCNM
ncbi:hypothetical protein TSAR_014236 [Trichomalopsis sarcophagae]|uniref:RING-type domain-containing protein n=1 Tax=Trichomalopsis sarcophagae TaxID=543379 RepID=A0A232FKQ5_9HYME|nr:hypothetical protein TSAR_014236 [Trichomalopsis sarcophagae]